MLLLSGFFLGFFSSLHCVGMCGPIVMVLPLDRRNPSRKLLQLFAYQAGRIASYASLGLVFGLFGRGLYLAGMQQRLSVVLGIMMILAVVFMEKTWFSNLSAPAFRILGKFRSALGKRLRDGRLPNMLLLGILNGLLPCGMVYTALFGAVAMGNPLSGMLFMALFGLGIVPLLSGVAYLPGVLPLRIRQKMRLVVPIGGIIVGGLFIFRGLGMGIPYLSPDTLTLFISSGPSCH